MKCSPACPTTQTHVLVRAVRDRALTEIGGRLLAKIAAQPEAGRLTFDLSGRPGRTARQVTLAVRFCPVELRQPARGADRRDPPQLSLNLVEAREIDPPPGEEPIVWRLLTTHAVTSLAEAARIIDLYRCRWIVEQLFRALKSQGLDLEDSFLSDGDALECLAAAALIAACSVMQLVQGRGEAGSALPASRVFSPAEIFVIEALARKYEGKTEKQKNPHPRQSLAWAAWCIARAAAGTVTQRSGRPVLSHSSAASVASTPSRKASLSPQITLMYPIDSPPNQMCAHASPAGEGRGRSADG